MHMRMKDIFYLELVRNRLHYSQQHQLNDLLALLDYFGEQQAVFIGHDFGGIFA